MAIVNEKVIETLNNLIETCEDGREGFTTAAEGIGKDELKALFKGYAEQRAHFAAELQAEVLRLGGDPEDEGSASAALHRGWMNLKSALTGEDDAAIISECERGEDAAVKNYQEALAESLPADVRAAIERQFGQVREAHERVRALEKAGA